MAEGNLTCRQFTNYLSSRSEHLDEDIIKDITPVDGWIGHVSIGTFASYDGVSHTFDRFNRVFPNLSGCWTDVNHTSCVGTPCDPLEKKIGWGYTRDSYSLQQASYSTDLLCFDQIMSADKAKAQFAAIIEVLKDSTNIIMSDRFRTEALRIAGKKIVAGAGMTEFTFTTNDDCTQIVPSALPTSKLTIQMLMRQVEPLKLNGYFGRVPGMPKIVEFVTDEITGWSLIQGNAQLAGLFRHEDFVDGGNLFKYGIVNGIGNFGFRYDDFPMRFQLLADGVTLQRVQPYSNVPATSGIRGEVNDAYTNARYQIDFIWNKMAMKSHVLKASPVNPMMPFATRDFAGKWTFATHDLGADENGCVIENKRHNKGMFFADFKNATQAVRPEWIVAFLSEREIACVVDVPTCNDDPGYVEQDYNSANDPCPNPTIEFDLSDVEAPYQITSVDAEITCNGVPVEHTDSGSQATLADLAAWLNANVESLGTWSETATGIALDDSTCNTVELTVTTFA